MADEEALLLTRYAREQDAEAFRALVEAHQHMVFAVCHRVLHNRDDAEDAAQECFFRLAQKADQLSAPIAGWLHTVAVQRAIDMLRRRVARHAHEASAAARPPHEAPSWEDIRGHVDEAIAALPERLRLPVVLYYLEGRTQEDVARELSISQPAVSGRLKRAVAALRNHLDGAGVDLSAGALVPLLSANVIETAPATLTAALGKMALAGVSGGVAGGLGAAKIATLLAVSGAALLCVVGAVVWTLRVWDSGRRDRPVVEELPVAASLSGVPPAGRTVELVVGGTVDGSDMFIDLDTGDPGAMPAGVAELPALVAWMREAGYDAFYNRGMSPTALIAADLALVRVPNEAWDGVARAARLPVPESASGFPAYLEAGRTGTATYCIRTREGTTALIQLVGVGRTAGKGIRIRWKPVVLAAGGPAGP